MTRRFCYNICMSNEMFEMEGRMIELLKESK